MNRFNTHIRPRIVGAAIALPLMLAACVDIMPEGYPLSSTVRDCLKNRKQFGDVWGCVQTRFASGQMGEPDARLSAFVKLGDDLAGRVSTKEITDAEAKTRLAVGAADLDKS